MSKTSWSKGFVRLWIVLSIEWVGVVFVALGKDHFKGLWQPHASIELEYKGEIKDVLDSSRPPDELRHRIVDLVKRGAAKLQSTDPVEAKNRLKRLWRAIDPWSSPVQRFCSRKRYLVTQFRGRSFLHRPFPLSTFQT
jgi:hypothetical protein